jgi:two-component system response regulator YesN
VYRVLIIDEDMMVRTALKKVIEKRKDFRVSASFCDGEEALQYCKSHTPNLIFLDLKIHEKNGLDLIREIRSLHPEAVTCLMSVYQNLDTVREALSLNVKHYLLKPISAKSIHAILDEMGAVEEDYSELMEEFREVVESKDFHRVFTDSRILAAHVLEHTAGDKDVAEAILKTAERELLNAYVDNPFEIKQELDCKRPINHEFLDDPVVIEMWIAGILDDIFKYRFAKRYSSVSGVLSYVDEHIKEPIVMAEIVANCHICQQYLLRIFKEQIGMSTRDYIQYRKIMMAKWYLYLGDYPTLDIAMKLGFDDSGYFAKVFKKLEHVTPYQYRLNCNVASRKAAVE